jgi:hypothetical protein
MNTNTSAQKPLAKPLKMAVASFCIIGLALLAFIFGVSYQALHGPNFIRFADWQSLNLWQMLFEKGCQATIAASVAAISVYYLVSKRMQNGSPNGAACSAHPD